MTIRTFVRTAFTAALLVGSSAAFAQTAEGENAEAPAQPAGPVWAVTCANNGDLTALRCNVFQELRVQQSGQRLVRIEVGVPGGDVPPVFAMNLPHGINFTEGAKLTVDDGDTRQFPIQSADQNGSYTQVQFDEGLANALRAGNQGKLVLSLLNGQNLEIPVSLNGFTKAVDLAFKAVGSN